MAAILSKPHPGLTSVSKVILGGDLHEMAVNLFRVKGQAYVIRHVGRNTASYAEVGPVT